MVLDTETIHSVLVENGENLAVKDVLEISWQVLDRNGVVIHKSKRNFINKDFWNDHLKRPNEFLQGSTVRQFKNFALSKVERWTKALEEETHLLSSWEDILQQLAESLGDYKVTYLLAYNINFDINAINLTSSLLGVEVPLIINEVDFIDIQKMVEVIAVTPEFLSWTLDHNSFTEKGNIKTSAEAIYQFITNNGTEVQTKVEDSILWNETHIASEDVDCETTIVQAILSYCLSHRLLKVECNCYGNWKAITGAINKTATKNRKVRKALDKINTFLALEN